MPRTKVETSRLEYLSILDEDGRLDETLEPDLSTARLLEMHQIMLLSRRFGQRLRELQREGRLAGLAPGEGLEAAQIGAVAALGIADWIVPSYRDIAALIWRGASLSGLLEDYVIGNAHGIHSDGEHPPTMIPVGAQMLHAAGLAYGFAQQGADCVVVALIGDGATSHEELHDAIQFAAEYRSPLVLVAQSAPGVVSAHRSRERPRSALQVALDQDICCMRVDGNDVLSVHAATREAVERARRDRAPSFVECATYRFPVHAPVPASQGAWDARAAGNAADQGQHDPVSRFQAYLRTKGLLLPDDLRALEAEIGTQIAAAVDVVGSAMEKLDPSVMIACMTGDIPRHTKTRRGTMRLHGAAHAFLK